MENNNPNDGGSKFLNGFILGAIIGGGIVFLLGTKKGKQILKSISEDGLDNISEFIDQQGQVKEDLDDEEVQESNDNLSPTSQPDKKPLVRRFFRGISRKL